MSMDSEEYAKESWRLFRIMSEFVMGFDVLAQLRPAVTIFGSSRVQEGDPVYELARTVGRRLGQAGFSIVTGGGPGIMEAANRGALEMGASSAGLTIKLPEEQEPNAYQTLSLNSRYFFVRNVMLVKYATAFALFPGGFGTFDEFFETITLIQTGKVRRFPIVLVGRDYWPGLIEWMERQFLDRAYISDADSALFEVVDTPDEVLRIVTAAQRSYGRSVDNVRLA
ncbi:MAG: TIGR00730 family Rossman fold protein [Chloroflexi bacterium]|nr:TIGR00730 family Rossman fold protein [Chloroflexota bacterium]